MKKETTKTEKMEIKAPIYMSDPRGFIYMKEDQSSSLITPEEREAWLDSLK